MKPFSCLNKSLLTLSVFLALSLFIAPPASAEIRQITNNNYVDVDADIDGDKVVWRGTDGIVSEIYLYDIPTQTTTQITNDEFTDVDPRIQEGKIVWQSLRVTGSKVFLYDIATATTVQLNDDEFRAGSSRIDDGKVVWNADDGTGSEIFMYDIASATTTQITDNALNNAGAEISNGLITWEGNDGSDSEIYLYNIATATTTQITDNTYNDSGPQISGGKIAWTGFLPEADTEIFYYDVATGMTTMITNNDVIDTRPKIDAGKIVWEARTDNTTSQSTDIFIYDTVTGSTTRITDNPERDQFPQIKDGHVMWITSTNILKHYDVVTGEIIDLFSPAYFREFPRYNEGRIVWTGLTSGSVDSGEIFLWEGPFQNFNTPAGTNVEYSDNGVQLTFSNVTSGGNTTITSSNQGNQPPAGFKIGAPPTYFSISTSATFTGTVEVCINYSTLDTNGNENNFKLMHFEPGVGWVNTTTSLDTVNNIICGNTTSFSDFTVMAAPTIPDLISTVQSMNLQQGITNSLDAKLSAANEALTATNNGQAATAVNKLNAFINEVEAQRGNKLTNARADELHAFATNLIKIIQGQNTF